MSEKQSENSNLFSVKNICIGLLIVLSLPILISLIISSGNWLSFIDGDSTVWIGFWGSYLGGIIGTAGVIYVANLQNNKQKEENEKIMNEQRKLNKEQITAQIESMHTIEKYERDRLKSSALINMLEEYRNDVSSLNSQLINTATKLSDIYIKKKSLSEIKAHKTLDIKSKSSEVSSLINNLENIDTDFKDALNKILSRNKVLSKAGLNMNNASIKDSDNMKSLDNLKDDLKYTYQLITYFKGTDASKHNNFVEDYNMIKKDKNDLYKDPLDDEGIPLKRMIYFISYEIFIEWLEEELIQIDENIIKLLNELE